MAFDTLEEVIRAPEFPEVDVALRRGRHIGPADGDAYHFLCDARHHLEPFYARFDCELVYRTDDFVFLLPLADTLGRRHLEAAEMLVGQMLALMRLDPSTTASGGVVTTTEVVDRLDGLLRLEGLVAALGLYRSDNYDRRRARERVVGKLRGALRSLRALGFVDTDGERHRLRPALVRFIDPVREAAQPAAALARLIAAGQIEVPVEAGQAIDADGSDDFEDTDDFDASDDSDAMGEPAGDDS